MKLIGSFTQPKLYNIIAKHPNPKDIYLQQLEREAILTSDDAKKIEEEYQQFLEDEFTMLSDQVQPLELPQITIEVSKMLLSKRRQFGGLIPWQCAWGLLKESSSSRWDMGQIVMPLSVMKS